MRLALFYWGATLGAQSGDPAAEAQRAKELMTAGQYEQAIPIYQRIVKAMHPHLFDDANPPAVEVASLGDLGGAIGAALKAKG